MARTNPGVTDHEDCSQTPRKTRMDPCKPMPTSTSGRGKHQRLGWTSTSGRGKHQRLGWTTFTLISIILLMSPADQCNATTSNNDRLPTIAEPQLTTSSHNQFASLLAAAQTHFNTTKVCGIRPHSVIIRITLDGRSAIPMCYGSRFLLLLQIRFDSIEHSDKRLELDENRIITQYPLRTYPCETVISKPGSLIQCTNCKKPLSVKIDAIMGPFPWCVQTTEK
ncbi:unnamed protein product [Arctogadus glacialis]